MMILILPMGYQGRYSETASQMRRFAEEQLHSFAYSPAGVVDTGLGVVASHSRAAWQSAG